MNVLELNDLAHEINEAEVTIEALEDKTRRGADQWLSEVLLQGQRLIKAKQARKHGEWMDWLAAKCPRVHIQKANRYMRWAANAAHNKELESVASLRQALALCEDPRNKEQRQSKSWPAYIEALNHVARFNGYLERLALERWPDESVSRLKEQLEPVAARLWPEKFS